VLTRDAYAWALFANGEHAEAHKQMQTALAVGIRDPRMLERARVIAAAQSVSSTAQGNGSR
jgi:hypothetical protein